MTKERILKITYGTSRGRDTYGYKLVSLFERGKKVASCNGGGYDMRGTVFGDWLFQNYQERLLALARKPGAMDTWDWDGSSYLKKQTEKRAKYYGGSFYRKPKDPKASPYVSLDGACGFTSMTLIAEAIGLKIRDIDAGKRLDIFLITDTLAEE